MLYVPLLHEENCLLRGAQHRFHFVRIVAAQVFADGQSCGRSFASGADQLFRAARAHIECEALAFYICDIGLLIC